MAKFKCVYWERTTVEREIEADDDADARRKMRDMVVKGEIYIGIPDLADSGVEAEKISD